MSDKNIIRCSGCRKIIGEGVINDGHITIKCKCGVMNTLVASKKQEKFVYNQPYQDRMNLQKK